MRCRFIPCGLITTALAVLALGNGACDPYGTFDDPDERLGPVDPVTFPTPNVGTGGDRKRPGRGRFFELTAYVDGAALGYFSYPLPGAAPTGTDPLRLLEDGKPQMRVTDTGRSIEVVPAPPAYVFDGDGDSPFPDEDRHPCRQRPGYTFSPRRDEVDYSQMGPIFSKLPEATYTEGALPVTRYVPVVAEATLGSDRFECQQLKSTRRIKEMMGAMPPTTGKYLAWLIIDPAAPVYPRENPNGMAMGTGSNMHPGVGLQRWGWYNRYLLAFLDGGYIPTEEVMVPGPSIDTPTMIPVVRMKPQRLFVPRQIQVGMGTVPGRAGAGYDVLEFARNQPGYSPLCQVWEYGDMTMPAPPVAGLPKSAQSILTTPGLDPKAASPATYVYCLQVR
jgi:hypothetical protein